MPAIGTSTSIQLAYLQELIFGTAQATPTGQLLALKDGSSIKRDRKFVDNPEYRSDGMAAPGIGLPIRTSLTLSEKLKYGVYDDFIASALGNFGWTANVAKIKKLITSGSQSIAVAATGKTFTRSTGSFVTDGFAVGDYISTYGFTAAGDNGTFLISGVTATVITCSTATGLVDEASAAGRVIMTNIRPSFTFENAERNTGAYFPFLGSVVSGFEISAKNGDALDISIDFMVKDTPARATSTLFTGGLTAPLDNPLIRAADGTIKWNTVAVPSVGSWNLKVERNLAAAEVCGSTAYYDIQPNTHKVTGSMELYFDSTSIALYDAMVAESDGALQFNLGPGVNKSYTFDLTRVRLKNWNGDPKNEFQTVKVDYESYVPASGTNTSLMATRLP